MEMLKVAQQKSNDRKQKTAICQIYLVGNNFFVKGAGAIGLPSKSY